MHNHIHACNDYVIRTCINNISIIVSCADVSVTLRASEAISSRQTTIGACAGGLITIECEVTNCHGTDWIIPNILDTRIVADDSCPTFDTPAAVNIIGGVISSVRNEDSTTLNMTTFIMFYYDNNLRNLTGETTTVECKNPNGTQSDAIHIVSKSKCTCNVCYILIYICL